MRRRAGRLARATPRDRGRGRDEEASRVRAELGELAVEQRGPVVVERAVRLVEDEQLGLVQERAAEREPLEHAARERLGALVARVPEAEALEQHPDPLAALGHAVEPAVEVEVLERGQLPVDERLVAEEADRARAVASTRELAGGRHEQPGASRSSVVFPEPFGPVTSRNPPPREVEVEARRGRASRRSARPSPRASITGPPDVPLPDMSLTRRTRPPPHGDRSEEPYVSVPDVRRSVTSQHVARTNPKNAMLITPFMVKNAASSRRRSSGPDERVLVRRAAPATTADAEPVERRRRAARAPTATSRPPSRTCSARARGRRRARRSASPTSAAPARGRSRRRRASRRGRSRRPRPPPRRRASTPARAGRRGSPPRRRSGASPSTAPSHRWHEPRDPLQVRVDDEADDRDRPEPAHDRVELPDGDEEDRERRGAEGDDLATASRAAPAARGRPCAGCARRCRASISRFSAIASERAPTIATVIQTRSCALGTPSTARNAPT